MHSLRPPAVARSCTPPPPVPRGRWNASAVPAPVTSRRQISRLTLALWQIRNRLPRNKWGSSLSLPIIRPCGSQRFGAPPKQSPVNGRPVATRWPIRIGRKAGDGSRSHLWSTLGASNGLGRGTGAPPCVIPATALDGRGGIAGKALLCAGSSQLFRGRCARRGASLREVRRKRFPDMGSRTTTGITRLVRD